MNEKTAKLIRKYAEATEANLNDLKRQWNAMDQFERRDFRIQMRAAVDSAAEAVDDEASDVDGDETEVEAEA